MGGNTPTGWRLGVRDAITTKNLVEGKVAHDRQLPEELVERKKESKKPTAKQSESLAVLADWWALYGQIYRDDPTELLAMGFRETLIDLPSEILHQSCLQAQRESPEFRPRPGRIYEIARNLIEKNSPSGNRPKWLDEPQMSEAERQQALDETAEQRTALKQRLGLRA
jgi:hypothetical protein